MSVTIKLRRGTSLEWTNSSPNVVLSLGEPGFETDTHKLKIGDGTTEWNSLDYISDGFSGVGGPLDYTYAVSYSANTFVPNDVNIITNLNINPMSHDIDFSAYYDDLIDNSYAINMTLTQVDDANKAILFSCNNIVDLTSGTPHPYYSFDVAELSRSASFTGFEYTKKYYLNIDIKGQNFPELTEDKIDSLIVAGSGISKDYDDAADPSTLTISVSGLDASYISDFSSAVSGVMFDIDGSLKLSSSGNITSGEDTAQVGYRAVFTQDFYGHTDTGLVSGSTVLNVGSNAQLLALLNPSTAYSNNQFLLYNNITITYSDNSTQTFSDCRCTDINGSVLSFGYNATTIGHNFPITLQTSNYVAATTAPQWTFGTDGELTLPASGSITFPDGSIQTTAPTVIDVVQGSGVSVTSSSGTFTVGVSGLNASYISDFSSSVSGLIFQIGPVDLHNGGVQTAQVLQFDDNSKQSVITGPTPPSGDSAKRIIVQGQRAEGGGEGGDVYVWGGDSDANGGDIKIYAGDADNVSPDSGNGGYVNIDGGAGATNGGDVEITAGYSEGGSAGDVIIAGGSTSSGVAGTVNIESNYGNWIFSPDTSLTLPHGGIITDDVETVTLSGAGTVEVNQTYRLIAVGSYGPIWVGTTNNYQIETKEAPSTGYLVRLTTEFPPTGYYESEDLITWTIVSGEGGGVSPVPTGVIVPRNLTLTVDTSGWTFESNGSLTLPSGSILSETNNTLSLMPPTAVAGQSLVIRATNPTGITSDHSGGFAAGDTITITITPDNGNVVTGTVDYTFTGDFGIGELGNETTGTLTFTDQANQTLTWTVPVESSMTTFTFTLSNAAGFGLGGLTALTLTGTGSSEDSHIHLVSGDPSTVDIYLGDDDQYIKIEKNAGDVVIGTNSDTNHWTFGTDGTLTLPQGGVIDETLSVDTLTLVGAALADVNQTYIKTSPTLYTGSNGVTIEAIGDGIWFCIQGGDTKYSSTDNLITWDNSTGGLPVPTSTVNLGVDTVNITVGTETWTFGQDGMLTFPGGDISIGTMTQYGQATPAIIASPDMSIGMVTSGASGSVALQWVDDIDTPMNSAGVVVNPYNNTGTVQIMSSSGQWTFGADGNLTFPDGSIQTTAPTVIDVVQGSGVSVTSSSGTFTVGVSGLNASYISDFSSSVSGLIPVVDVVQGSGVSVTSSSGTFTVGISGLDSSYISDFASSVSGLIPTLSAGSGIGLTAGSGNSIIISSSGTVSSYPTPTVVNLSVVSSTVSTDASAGQIFNVALTSSATLSNPTNPIDGVTLRWRIQQDAYGSHAVTLGDKFQIPTSATSPLPFSTAPYTIDLLAATYNSATVKWDIIAFVMGY